MASKKKAAAAPAAPAEVADGAAPEVAAPAKSSKHTAVVTFQGGTREFSREVHGDDFKDLADEFAETHKGEVV